MLYALAVLESHVQPSEMVRIMILDIKLSDQRKASTLSSSCAMDFTSSTEEVTKGGKISVMMP